MPLSQVVSIVGSVLLLAAYGAMQTGYLKTDTYTYQLLNLFGAACLTYSVIQPFNSGVFVTEVAWTIFSIVGLWKIALTVRRKRAKADGSAAGLDDAQPKASGPS